MTPSSPRRAATVLGLAAIVCGGLVLSAVESAGAERGAGSFLVPTSKRTGFGAFQEGPHAAARLRHAFGPPSSEHANVYAECLMKWSRLGINVELFAPSGAKDACGEGSFGFARLTDPRWHTAGGVRPGGGRASAQRASLLRCHANTPACGATGYALELHECSGGLRAGVIAHPRGNRIEALDLFSRRC